MNGLARLGATLRALWIGVARPRSAQAVDADDAPAAWVDYARRVAQHLAVALDDGADAAACRVRGHLEHQAAQDNGEGAPPRALRLKAWLDGNGAIARVESTPGFGPAFAADLRAALVGRAVGVAPPSGMTQPVVVRVLVASAP
ncbi:hypothetical protein NUV26_06955 [Burkholderia pseudomultivorans]|uniref:hypothetical protein n=1 Tax=Burkholderia pseudomultivorans TaxID=1207504 RepID=UPI0007579429|nr:hypothetical protein [Burkholderia pseudomultivorans]KVC18100.1 hypothetical protein WS55_24480 [Burkholderia pseudomultivorans]KVC32975.1 hypothetical protein WS56_13800 [Burkholderia pseudomultivorans]KVC57243.1 hypothetical protein WS58_28760 [Burkholderia pseudomultivorans]MDS0791885.1 hypothetical protein [Burkholderia pseudomultivorans]